jgi:hypothetical protein
LRSEVDASCVMDAVDEFSQKAFALLPIARHV